MSENLIDPKVRVFDSVSTVTENLILLVRGVAQPGRALGSGPRGRRFESSRPDHSIQNTAVADRRPFLFCARSSPEE